MPDAPHSDNETGRAHAVREELLRVLAAPALAGALSQQRLLRHLVERTLEGHADTLKETLLAIEVFQRTASRFDTRADSIVRVEARRLRNRLRQHYAATSATTAALRIELPKGSYKPLFVDAEPARGTPRSQAAELVERGLYFQRQGQEDGYRKALARYQQAAALAPALAAAQSGIARAWMQLVATNIGPPLPGVTHALAAVRRALELEPRHAESMVQAALMTHRFEFDWPAAQLWYRRATETAPESAIVLHTHAFSLMVRAEFDAAEALLAKARRIDPRHLMQRAHQGLLQLYRGDWAAAEETLRAMLDMTPDNVLGLSLLAYVALQRGDAALALEQYRRVSERHPLLSIGLVGQALSMAALGRADEARAVLHGLKTGWRGGCLSPYQLAMVHERLDEHDAALDELARAIDERDPNALTLPVDPAFAALRAAPRGHALVAIVLGAQNLKPQPAARQA